MDFGRARQYIGDKGEVIKDDGVIYKTKGKGNQVAELFNPMSDFKDLVYLLNELNGDNECDKLSLFAEAVNAMDKPDYESLRKILELAE